MGEEPVTVTAAAAAPCPTGSGRIDQQRQRRTHCDGGDGAAQHQTAHRRAPQWPREADRAFDQPEGQYREHEGHRCRGEAAREAERMPQERRREQQHRPVPQIPRVRHPPDRAHHRHRQRAADSPVGDGAAGAHHQRGAEHRQQRRGTGIGRRLVQLDAGEPRSSAARPIPRSPPCGRTADAIGSRSAPPARRSPVPRRASATRRTPTRAASASTPARSGRRRPRRTRGRATYGATSTRNRRRARCTKNAVPMINAGHSR